VQGDCGQVNITFDSWQDLFFSIVDGLLSFVLLFTFLGVGLRITTWLIGRGVKRRKLLMRGWDYAESDEERTESITRVLITAARAVFGLLAVVLLLNSFGVNLGAILASVSLISIALGFGAQYLVRDYLSGILMLTEDQFRVGDSVEINKISGTVEDMRLRLTVLRDGDGTVHHIPNGEIRVASNRSKEFNKINQVVTVPYGADLREVFRIIDRIGADIAQEAAWKAFVREPMHASRIQELGDKGIVVKVNGETIPGKGGAVEGEFRLRLMDAFAHAGIEVPYPQIVVHRERAMRLLQPGSTAQLTDRATTDDEHDKDDANE
jgi:small conductance mechanosensitive channel